jgi:hypothetical protein
MPPSTPTATRATSLRGVRLAEELAAAQGGPIERDGQLVHMLYELPPVTSPARLRVALTAGAPRPQGLRLKARGGSVRVNDQLLDDVVLWTDTAPPELTVELVPKSASKPLVLRAWNAWRDPAGSTQAWIGDAGLLIADEGDGSVVLSCSDGFDAVDFSDLVARLTLAA